MKFGSAGREITHFLTVRSLYDIGHLTLESGEPIPALRIRAAPTVVQLVDNQTGWGMETLPLPTALSLLQLQPGEIIPGSNCHGYTFARSGYWIENDAVELLLQGDRFVLADPMEASIAVFRDRVRIVHSCVVTPARDRLRYVGKAGVGAIQETEDEHTAARGNPYTQIDYYRRS